MNTDAIRINRENQGRASILREGIKRMEAEISDLSDFTENETLTSDEWSKVHDLFAFLYEQRRVMVERLEDMAAR